MINFLFTNGYWVLVRNKSFFAILLIWLFSISSYSQVIWATPSGQAWLTNTNWTGNIIPAATDIAQFGIAPTSGVIGIGINMNNPTNNGVNNQAVGAIEILNTRIANIKIGNNSTLVSGTLTLNGALVNGVADVVLRNNATSIFTIDNRQAIGSMSMAIELNDVTDNKIYIGNSGGITINTIISGVGRKLSLYGIGTGVLQLNAVNTYSGATTIGGSIIQLNNSAGKTLPATNDVIVDNGGTLKISTNQTLHNITLNVGATLLIDAGVSLTINGTFYNNGGAINSFGNIVYGTGATLVYGAIFPQITSDAEFPVIAGPTNVIINNVAGVSLHAVRNITGILHFAVGNFILGANNFTNAGTTGLVTTSTHVVTNGMGKLIITTIGASPIVFPIGINNNSINPVIISNGNGASYGARVEQGFGIPIMDASKAVNRTWILQSLSTPNAAVAVSFCYFSGDGNPSFNYTAPVDHGIYLPMGFGWNINQTGLPQAGNYQVDTQVSSFLAETDLPMVIGNLGAILSDNISINLIAQNNGGHALLSWNNDNWSAIHYFEMERSVDGIHFTSLINLAVNRNNFEDETMLEGANYYRLKINLKNEKIIYSNVVLLVKSLKNLSNHSLQFSLIHSNNYLSLYSPKQMQLIINILDISGRLLQQKKYVLFKGNNRIEMNSGYFAAGLYWITGYSENKLVFCNRFILQ